MRTYVLSDDKTNRYLAASSFNGTNGLENYDYLLNGIVMTEHLDRAAFVTGLDIARQYAGQYGLVVKKCDILVDEERRV